MGAVKNRALDITRVETETTKVAARDLLPGSNQVDYTGKPTGKEPDLMEKVRIELYKHPEVEQIFTPWHLMSQRGKTFATSFQGSVVRKLKDTAYSHRNHLHFHIKLD